MIRFLKVILLFLFSLPLLLWLWWYFSPAQPLRLLVVDKTVVDEKAAEHLSLFWVLKHDKYYRPDGEPYDKNRDYMGFFPDGLGGYETRDLEGASRAELQKLADTLDMVYFTDLYGVYRAEWLASYPQLEPERRRYAPGAFSELMYGGMTSADLFLLAEMKAREKLIINEFNVIASPTTAGLRQAYEHLFDLRWSGWVGRYFDDLDSLRNPELPRWLLSNYLAEHRNWPFTKAGVAFVAEDGQVAILEYETHMNSPMPRIVTSPAEAKYYGVADSMPYPFWFDVMVSGSSNEVVSHYQFDLHPSGDSILRHWGIPQRFPAVTRHLSDYKYFYFSGDFADNPLSMRAAPFKGIAYFDWLFYKEASFERQFFFWQFYRPMLRKILREHAHHSPA